MPYFIEEKEKGCFAVKDKKHPSHMFSKKCQSKKMAMNQRVAMALNIHKMTGEPMSKFFGKGMK